MTVETFQNPCFKTSGPWLDEPMALADLDSRLAECGQFRVFREVEGYLQQPRAGAEEKETMRVDRILIPNQSLVDLGWCYGAIAIEGKAPGKKLGAVVCQCLDYSRTVWEIGKGKMWMMCPWTFIWHVSEFAGDIASVMTQHRIGGACYNTRDRLVLKHAAGALLRIDESGSVLIGHARCGMKAGSR